jgi:hypothetical protein
MTANLGTSVSAHRTTPGWGAVLPGGTSGEQCLSRKQLGEATELDYLQAWSAWERLLLAVGGRVVLHPEKPEDRLSELLARGRLVLRAGESVQLDNEGSVERAVAELWLAGSSTDGCHVVTSVGYGYALREDGVWYRHTWVITDEHLVLDTRRPALAYAGVHLDFVDSLVFAALHTS